MTTEPNLYYFVEPGRRHAVSLPVQFVTVADLLADEPACRKLWDLIVEQFHTRSKFLAIWPSVRFVALHRNRDGELDGFLLVSAPVNWQIDYVVVDPASRGQGIASALLLETLNQAADRQVPYLMLTSKASLRPLYESVGFRVIEPGPVNSLELVCTTQGH